MSSSQVIALARDAMQNALLDNEQQSAAVNSDLKPGVTIDLSRKGIQKLPEEVVDIIKNELERLVLTDLIPSGARDHPLTRSSAGLPCHTTSWHHFPPASPSAPLCVT